MLWSLPRFQMIGKIIIAVNKFPLKNQKNSQNTVEKNRKNIQRRTGHQHQAQNMEKNTLWQIKKTDLSQWYYKKSKK